MTGQTVGYIRVSSVDQNSARQLSDQTLDRVFEDKASGKDANRPALKEMLAFVRMGDTVVVHSIDRLARNSVDLLTLVKTLNDKGVTVQFVKETLIFSADKTNPNSQLMLTMMSGFAEFERSLIRERQREGIAAAKASGKALGRRASLSPADIATLKKRLTEKASKASIAAELGVSRATVYNAINALNPA